MDGRHGAAARRGCSRARCDLAGLYEREAHDGPDMASDGRGDYEKDIEGSWRRDRRESFRHENFMLGRRPNAPFPHSDLRLLQI